MEQASPDAIAADVAEDRLSVSLLGGFSVSVGRRAIEPAAWRLRKASHLIKLLALAPGQRLHDELVMDLLWPELSPEAAYNNLRATLYFGRRLLEPDAAGTFDYLRLQGGLVSLAPETAHRIDVAAYEAAAAEAHASDDPDAFLAALDLYTGELLPEDRYLEWLDERREALRMSRLALLLGLARRWEERGDSTAAIETLRQALEADSAHEEAHVRIMRLHALAGQRSQALRQYQHLRDALQRELDVEPDPASARLYEAILAGRFAERSTPDPARPPAVPPLSARSGRSMRDSEPVAPPGNLPAQLSSFIGRERELTEVAQSLEDSRLLTLTGPGGSGKTRLAIQAAGRLAGRFPDGVWFVDLSALTNPLLAPHAIATALDVHETPGRDSNAALEGALRDRRMLLVLDNCEHLVAACAALAERLLLACPRLAIVATSREVLRVAGEAVLPVPPLGLPVAGGREPVEQLGQVEAVRLFVERARLARHGFALTDENAAAVSQVCRTLEGLPLAIELAAARVRAAPVEQLAGRLDDALRLLSGGARGAPARQQTLRATIDWSYQFLTGAEQALLRRLAVFAGGFTLEAAETVCAGGDAPPDEVLDLLFQLIDKSLIVVDEREGDVRYRLLETIRQYAEERLEQAGEASQARERHVDWYLTLTEQAEHGLVGLATSEWMQRLLPEIDNIRVVHQWSVRRGDLGTVVRLAGALWSFWLLSGRLSEGRGWLEAALSDPEIADVPEPAWTRALGAAGLLAQRQGDYRQAVEWSEECLSRSRIGGDKWNMSHALTNLCVCALYQGDIERTIALAHEALEMSRAAGVLSGVPTGLSSLGLAEYWRGDFDAADRYLREAVAAAREIGFTAFASWLIGQLADVARLRGDSDLARRHAEESIALGETAGDAYGPALGRRELGRLAADAGERERATRLIAASLGAFRALGYKLRMIECLEDLAELAAGQADTPRAVRLLSATERLRGVEGSPPPPFRQDALDQLIERSRAVLDIHAFDAALAEGQAMTLEQAVEHALTSAPD